MSIPISLKIAIVGAGPGGLAAAIQLNKLAGIELSLFEAAKELREIGAGINLNENTWRLLVDLGAARHLEPHVSAVRDANKLEFQQRSRNGNTGELYGERYQDTATPGPPSVRVERYKLQSALLAEVPIDLIQLSKRLASIEESLEGSTLFFQDGTCAGKFDLVIGADGIKSVVRQHIYPDHKLTYTGKIAYRVLIPQSKVAHIEGIPPCATFWHTPNTHVYTNPIYGGLFEIATRALEGEEFGNKVQYGQVASRKQVAPHYKEYTDTIRQIIEAPDSWLSFAMFGGPRLERVVSKGSIALIGDASHPLSGAFGSGAAFAFEDAYVLKNSIEYSRSRGQSLSFALELYDSVRSPHYKGLYEVLDSSAANARKVRAVKPPLPPNEIVKQTVQGAFGQADTSWIYKTNIIHVWADRVKVEDGKLSANQSEKHINQVSAWPIAQEA